MKDLGTRLAWCSFPRFYSMGREVLADIFLGSVLVYKLTQMHQGGGGPRTHIHHNLLFVGHQLLVLKVLVDVCFLSTNICWLLHQESVACQSLFKSACNSNFITSQDTVFSFFILPWQFGQLRLGRLEGSDDDWLEEHEELLKMFL